MRLILIVLILLIAVSGALFSALNGLRVPIDFYFFSTELPLGPVLLLTLSFGWLFGGIVSWLGQAPRLRRQVRLLELELRAVRGAQPDRDKT